MARVTLRDVAVRDFRSLAEETQRQARRQLDKLARHPELGDELGHRMGVNLTGYRAVHFGRNRYRIVYRWIRDQDEVEVWGIGKRERGGIYRMVGRRTDEASEK
jgi:mRNA-degrading endonuclease RelE of RelBE toxin-antitoxin system